MISAILIANRGEIACRIIRTCRRLGLRTIAIFSDADARARHVKLADEAYRIGPAAALASYLDIRAILNAAHQGGADAIHPGYGFLAENPTFARACTKAGLIFIGPSPEAIEAMGDKQAAKKLMSRAGIPVIPGYHGSDQSDAAFRREAGRLGYPLMVKAAAGGGGKGMRLVADETGLLEALSSARHEAAQAFGRDTLLLEAALSRPRHIEFQVFGDRQGNIIHLGERECSVQRRHQKIIEESPAPGLSAEQRERMGEAAVAAARAIGYQNAGTVEFLLDSAGKFYFLEMNTRLQVEHPVTEMVTGFDLVAWQIRIAQGESLPLVQEAVTVTGHSVEARLYAEDPANGFLPTTGNVLVWRQPTGEHIRVESGIGAGDEITVHYDPLLAKIIAYGHDRRLALRRLRQALVQTVLLGVTSNLDFLRDVLDDPQFRAGELTTNLVESHFSGWRPPAEAQSLALMAATVARFTADASIHEGGYWRNNPNRPPLYRFQPPNRAQPIDVQLAPVPFKPDAYRLSLAGDNYDVSLLNGEPGEVEWTLLIDGRKHAFRLAHREEAWWIKTPLGTPCLKAMSLLPEPDPSAVAGASLRAPMPGAVLAVLVKVGQRVSQGQALMKLEAMKMEHTIRAAVAGIVEAVYYVVGDTVEADAELLRIGAGES